MSESLPILTFEDPADTLPLDIPHAQFAASPLAQHAAARLEGPRTRYSLENATLAGKSFRVDITFTLDRLDRIEFFLHAPGDNAGWDQWSEASERTRKETLEAWASALFGKPMEVRPFILDGQVIKPFEVTWMTVRHIPFEWGEVLSVFDSKAMFSTLMIQIGAAE